MLRLCPPAPASCRTSRQEPASGQPAPRSPRCLPLRGDPCPPGRRAPPHPASACLVSPVTLPCLFNSFKFTLLASDPTGRPGGLRSLLP